jgi:hypothetical protein
MEHPRQAVGDTLGERGNFIQRGGQRGLEPQRPVRLLVPGPIRNEHVDVRVDVEAAAGSLQQLYASTVWPLQSLTNSYLLPAFDIYRNYDGNSSTVGDLAVTATTSDTANTSVYAFAHSADANELELVAINKNSTGTPAAITISNAAAFTTATAYNLVDGNPAVVAAAANPSVSCSGGTCTLSYTMPATSATTVVLR